MKIQTFPLFAGSITLIAVATISAARPTVSLCAQVTQVATAAVGTNQCSLINLLVVDQLATPAVTMQATMAAALSQAQIATPLTGVSATPVPTTAAAESGAGEAGGGDEALTTYRDSKLKFSIGYPRSWSQDSTFNNGVCFTGRDASIAVQYVPGAVPADLLAYAKADEATIKAQAANYKSVYLKPLADATNVVVLGYEWDAGKSSITLKPVHARTDRYYFIDSLGRFVIVSETAAINQFDPAGVYDTYLTYQAAK